MLNKITFKNIAKCSLITFIFAVFPFITLSMFYSPVKSLLGLLFSYIGLISSAGLIYVLFFVKDKFFIISEKLSTKINSISNQQTIKYVKYSILAIGVVLSGILLYLGINIGSIVLNIMSFASALNPFMIIALNIYYLGMSYVYVESINGSNK